MNTTIDDFDVDLFETKLKELKDTQDSIQQLSAWCLQRKSHHKKIAISWLNVLKQVKIEHRLTLFYLANDVIQYSKRKNYDFVDSWGTSLQKATTLVRDEKIKHKILRIFKIWEQREVYNEEFLTDLNGLLSAATTTKKVEVPAVVTPIPTKTENSNKNVTDLEDFQITSIISSIKEVTKHEMDTDTNFKVISKSALTDYESILSSIKDRKHVEDASEKIDAHMYNYQQYVKSLKTEIKSRKILLAILEQAEIFYQNQRGEVKVVGNAYRNFGNRIKSMKKKLDELTNTLPSPIPSPDINAPSPSSETDIVLPDEQNYFNIDANNMMNSYMGTKLPFDINDFQLSPRDSSTVQTIQVINSRIVKPVENTDSNEFFNSYYTENSYNPSNVVSNYPSLSSTLQEYVNSSSTNSYIDQNSIDYSILDQEPNTGFNSQFTESLLVPDYDVSSRSESFNSTWDMPMSWDDPVDTPISPPQYERTAVNTNTRNYIETETQQNSEQDIDHRQLPNISSNPFLKEVRAVDVDHRNLIALTGSPIQSSVNNSESAETVRFSSLPPILLDQKSQDIDNRVTSIENKTPQSTQAGLHILPNTLLPPPLLFDEGIGSSIDVSKPPPIFLTERDDIETKNDKNTNKTEGTGADNTDSVDMDMSDEDLNLSEFKKQEEGASSDLLTAKNSESKTVWSSNNHTSDRNRQKIFHPVPVTNIDQNSEEIPENSVNWNNSQQFNNNINNNTNRQNFSPQFFQNSNIMNNNRKNFRGNSPFFRGRGRGKYRGRNPFRGSKGALW